MNVKTKYYDKVTDRTLYLRKYYQNNKVKKKKYYTDYYQKNKQYINSYRLSRRPQIPTEFTKENKKTIICFM